MTTETDDDLLELAWSALSKKHRTSAGRLQVALSLIASVRCALEEGCVHRNKAGDVLSTEAEILKCLRDERTITIDKPESLALRLSMGRLLCARAIGARLLESFPREPMEDLVATKLVATVFVNTLDDLTARIDDESVGAEERGALNSYLMRAEADRDALYETVMIVIRPESPPPALLRAMAIMMGEVRP